VPMAQDQDYSGRVISPVMNVAEVCEYLRIHRSTLYRLIKAGQFPHFRLGSDYRFTYEAIDQWRRHGEQAPLS
jgi:excisionase family DNA binding protein